MPPTTNRQEAPRYDGEWTFGNKIAAGYKHVSSHAVHQIVATAFLGSPPSEHHVVDHIDAIRDNNRPDNLRWVTRAENLFDSAITRKRIESIWGSVESMLSHFKTVSPDINSQSLKPMATQRRWRTPCEFPAYPGIVATPTDEDIGPDEAYDLLKEYAEGLVFGSVFSRNIYGESITVVVGLTKSTNGENRPALLVLTNLANSGVKEWAVARVTIEGGIFVHENQFSYITLQGALKAHCQLVGIPFEKSIDDTM